MLSRVAELPATVRGRQSERAGILAKMVKPNQEIRVDLPTIGLSTINGAVSAGLAGIAVEAGKCFVLDRAEVIKSADTAGIFIIGIPPAKNG